MKQKEKTFKLSSSRKVNRSYDFYYHSFDYFYDYFFVICSLSDYKFHETMSVLLILSIHSAYQDAKLIVIDK